MYLYLYLYLVVCSPHNEARVSQLERAPAAPAQIAGGGGVPDGVAVVRAAAVGTRGVAAHRAMRFGRPFVGTVTQPSASFKYAFALGYGHIVLMVRRSRTGQSRPVRATTRRRAVGGAPGGARGAAARRGTRRLYSGGCCARGTDAMRRVAAVVLQLVGATPRAGRMLQSVTAITAAAVLRAGRGW